MLQVGSVCMLCVEVGGCRDCSRSRLPDSGTISDRQCSVDDAGTVGCLSESSDSAYSRLTAAIVGAARMLRV